MADLMQRGQAARRATDVLLRGTGGRAVQLRVPAPAVAGDVTEQLGLASPGFADVELAPVAFRRARARVAEEKAPMWELLVSAAALEKLAGSGQGDVTVLMATAAGVLVDGVLMEIEAVTSSGMGGMAYVYRLLLQEPRTALI